MTKRLLAVAALAVLASACSPKVLTSTDLIGGRSVKYTYMKTGTIGSQRQGDQQNLYDFGIRVCDFDADSKETNCADTVLMNNVVFRPPM